MADYREFLLVSNGGRPVPDVVDVPGIVGADTDVQEFFGIKMSEESSSIDWNQEAYSERLEKELLPIACDSGGSVFCLSLRASDFGAVLYCDLQSVFADYESSPDLYLVAPSFTSFLEKLRLLA